MQILLKNRLTKSLGCGIMDNSAQARNLVVRARAASLSYSFGNVNRKMKNNLKIHFKN